MVPKIIHSIWIGNKKIPKEALLNMQSWESLNPEYSTKIWNDSDIDVLMKDSELSDIYFDSNSIGLKSDLARYEILNTYGGLYVDVDFQCLRPINNIINNSSFTYGDQAPGEPAIGFLASSPRSPFIKYLIPALKNNIENGLHTVDNFNGTLNKSGPAFFSKVLSMWYGCSGYNKVYDKYGDYIGNHRLHVTALFEWTIYPFNPYLGSKVYSKVYNPKAYASHQWWASWA